MRRLLTLFVVACITATSLRAQDSAPDTSGLAAPPQQNAWVSLGLGNGGATHMEGIAGIASGWYAYGPLVVGARYSEGGPFFGPSTHERAALVGLRARTRHTFALASVGGGTMGGWRSNGEQSGTRTTFPDETSIAFGAEAGVAFYVIGIGVDVFGAKSHRTSYSGIALSVQLGYLK
jgi:hypothetical protein